MDQRHEDHLQRIRAQVTTDLEAKYRAGQAEHGGNLWEHPGLIDEAIKEAIDQVVYLYTLRDQLNGRTPTREARCCGQ